MVVGWFGRMPAMWEAGVVVRVDQREVYVWNWSRVARVHVRHILMVSVGQLWQRLCWVLVVDLQKLQKDAAV